MKKRTREDDFGSSGFFVDCRKSRPGLTKFFKRKEFGMYCVLIPCWRIFVKLRQKRRRRRSSKYEKDLWMGGLALEVLVGRFNDLIVISTD